MQLPALTLIKIKENSCTYWMIIKLLPHGFCKLQPPKLNKNVHEPFCQKIFFCRNLKNIGMQFFGQCNEESRLSQCVELKLRRQFCVHASIEIHFQSNFWIISDKTRSRLLTSFFLNTISTIMLYFWADPRSGVWNNKTFSKLIKIHFRECTVMHTKMPT